jgi:plasmid stability protein
MASERSEEPMATLQVKGLDNGLYEALKALAVRESRSVSQQVVSLIKAALADPRGGQARATREFLELAGTWEDPREAAVIAQEMRASRRSRQRSDDVLDAFGALDTQEPRDQ